LDSGLASAGGVTPSGNGLKDPKDACVLRTPMPLLHYNSTRLPGSDKLDSSDLELTFTVSSAFLEAVEGARGAAAAACGARLARTTAASGGPGFDPATLGGLVSAELLYFDGTVPQVCVEEVDASAPWGVRLTLSALPPLAPRCVLHAPSRTLTLTIKRTFPISSGHGNRRFMLAFALGAEVVLTQPFVVLAKKAKAGVPAKVRLQPELVEVSEARAGVLARLSAVAVSSGATGTTPAPSVGDATATATATATAAALALAAVLPVSCVPRVGAGVPVPVVDVVCPPLVASVPPCASSCSSSCASPSTVGTAVSVACTTAPFGGKAPRGRALKGVKRGRVFGCGEGEAEGEGEADADAEAADHAAAPCSPLGGGVGGVPLMPLTPPQGLLPGTGEMEVFEALFGDGGGVGAGAGALPGSPAPLSPLDAFGGLEGFGADLDLSPFGGPGAYPWDLDADALPL
jgi:hypothetical protein